MAENSKNKHSHGAQDENALESKRILERVSQESETVGFSSIARVAEKTKAKLATELDDDDDPVVVLGKKIGRTMGIVALGLLALYLYATYFA